MGPRTLGPASPGYTSFPIHRRLVWQTVPCTSLTSKDAISACTTTQMLRLRTFFQHEGGGRFPYTPSPQSGNILRARTMQTHGAINDKNLGVWATLLQARVKYLPYQSHSALRMARRLSHVNDWHVAVTRLGSVIYLVFHIYLHPVYVGATTSALASRLRKHIIDAASRQDCATLHKRMLQTDLSQWGILPLQYVSDLRLASVRERHWWYTFRKCACIDMAPGISTGRGQSVQGMAQYTCPGRIHGLKEAKQFRDYPCIKYSQQDLRDLASKLSVPLYVLGSIVAPNLLPQQNVAIQRVTRRMVASVAGTAWKKEVINKAMRVVRGNPKTVRSVCEKAACAFDSLLTRPPCLCHLMHSVPGKKVLIHGHVAFVAVHITYASGATARPNDPLSLPRHRIRQRLINDLTAMGEVIGATILPLTRYLPQPKIGSTLKYLEQFVERISRAMYICCVNKGTGILWAFCRHWVWGILKDFYTMRDARRQI